MNSPRSVSTGWIPAAARAALSWISSLTIDFTLTTLRTPRRRARSTTYRRASSAVSAQPTWPPFSITRRSNCSRYRSRWLIASHFTTAACAQAFGQSAYRAFPGISPVR